MRTTIITCICIICTLNLLLAQDFTAIGQQKPFSISGSINARAIFYNVTGVENRREPFNYYLTGSPTINIYGISIPTSFSLSKGNRSFQQPFNQYGMSPKYKWITAHIGYRNISYSPYTLAGHTMLGGGLELTPGKFRFGFMYGRLNRGTTIDTTTRALVPFSFSRKGYAAKLGYGSSKNYFELSYLHAKDDSTSKPEFIPAKLRFITPEANDVLGYSAKFTLFKNVKFETDGAVSYYTNDIGFRFGLDVDTTNQLANRANNIFHPNYSSEFFTAFSASIGYETKKFGLKLNYKRIDPDFKSMGAYFFNSDLENWTVAPSFTLFKDKLRFSGSLGLQHDNLKDQKQAENKRVIGSANVGIQFSKAFSTDLVYSNYSDNQRATTLTFHDSIRIVQTTQTFMVMPRYMIIRPEIVHIIMPMVSINSLRDFNQYYENSAESHNIKTNQYMVNYTVSLPKKGVSLYTSLGYTGLKGQGRKNTFSSLSLGGNYNFLKKKMNAGLSTTLTNSKDLTANKSNIISMNGNLNYKIDKKQSLRLNLYLTNNRAKTDGIILDRNFTESRSELSYNLNF